MQVGYKLAGLNLEMPLINNLELVGRYDSLHSAYNSTDNAFDSKTQRYHRRFHLLYHEHAAL